MARLQHILVIRLSAMGDVAMTVPVIKRVTEEYPELKITVLTRKFLAPLYSDMPNVQVYAAEVHGRHKGVAGLKRLSRELQDLGIDAVADLHNVLRSNILKVFFQLQGIPIKQINKGRREKKALTRRDHKVFKRLKTTHQRYADVFTALGLKIDLEKATCLHRRQLPPAVKDLIGKEPKKWLGIAPFAQHDSKSYPRDLMKEVLRELEKDDLKIFLFGGGSKEIAILKEWKMEFPHTVNVAGKISFGEELALISNLDAMLSMDSGNGHLAANFGIPVITLWGLTHPYTGFVPFKQPETNSLLPDLRKYPAIPTSVYGKSIPEGYEEVMRTIPSEQVVSKIREVLS
ncbi:ADP-heptose:LPS heptosyltransferase [Salinimicrobium catena]|uniref:ADP-heptose:LPS heptosyltransferase n=1 Tax=Salinimicrobium catena TaxID=390640 RepID=A0A1H5IFD9_9FLAO|nr:glycosyltransferase family 9 protein [Salinimicrobium catena]SDK77332.1 ADP-heptose:LPS heptosyltransferase [Salinimicrobium catena]SEE38912.1 ADP-heptose:LPS heptosyltransferase [Salinimicrobium catena]